MTGRVLFVDDESNVLDSYRRDLRKQPFEVHTALGGQEGLKKIAHDGPFAVVISDMRMEGMDGVHFLMKVREVSPDSVRIMLTGADHETAIEAVNEGAIFRFLTKPCSTELLVKSLEAAFDQYRLVTAERTLLSTTLTGAVKILTDILSKIKPLAFGRASRIRPLVHQLAEELIPQSIWRAEIAALLSQVGCVSLPETMLKRAYMGQKLTPGDQRLFQQHPQAGRELVANVPRLEKVAEIIAYQEKCFDGSGYPEDGVAGEEIPMEARILKLALDYDALIYSGQSIQAALAEIYKRKGWYDPVVVAVLRKIMAAEVAKKILTAEVAER